MRIAPLQCAVLATALVCVGAPGTRAAPAESRPASPYEVLDPRLLVPEFLDVGPRCTTELLAEFVDEESGARLRSIEARARLAPLSLRGAMRDELDRFARASALPILALCARLEAARLALRMGFGPEALTELRRAERVLPRTEWPGGLDHAAEYLEAEARIVMQRGDEVEPALQAVVERTTAADPGVGDSNVGDGLVELTLAARLRLLDLRTRALVMPHSWPGEPPDAASSYEIWRAGRALLSEARERNFDLASWAVRAAEHAIVAERPTEAHQWLAIAEGVPKPRHLAAIRKADVLIELDRRDAARATLRRVIGTARDIFVRDLARIRLARHRLVTEGAQERLRLLQVAARSDHPIVASLARDQLALEHLQVHDFEGTLRNLDALAHSAPTLRFTPRFVSTLDDALAQASDESDCAIVLGRLARSWELFSRHATRAEPFARIGECFSELRMHIEAVRVYRALARTLGIESIPFLAWHVARASLETGDLSSARASLRASLGRATGSLDRTRIAIDSEEAARWWWLAGEFAEREGRDDETLAIEPVLAASKFLPDELRPSVEARLARLVNRLPSEAAAMDPVLAASLERAPAVALAERAILRAQLADREWRAGSLGAASQRYRGARAALDAPTAKSRAEYRVAIAERAVDEMREGLRGAIETKPDNAWSRIARVELRMVALREAIGWPAQVRP